MWFWFGLKILRLVNKKRFLKYWSVSILFELITSKKTAPSLISSKLAVQGIKRSGILHWFKKCVELLLQEVPKDFFPEKQFFAKFSKSLKIKFSVKFFYPFAKLETSPLFLNQRKIVLLLIPCTANFEEFFFSTLIRGGATFFEG